MQIFSKYSYNILSSFFLEQAQTMHIYWTNQLHLIYTDAVGREYLQRYLRIAIRHLQRVRIAHKRDLPYL